MSRLDERNRVFVEGVEPANGGDAEIGCAWFLLCDNPANGLRDHPILGPVPICVRCDDKVERISNE